MEVAVKKIDANAKIPTYAHPGDAGLDLYVLEETVLNPLERKSVRTGVSFAIPDGYVGLVWDKSGLSHKHGLKVYGGVIDAGYRGEVLVGILNQSDVPYTFEAGHKIAQLLIQPVVSATIIETDTLPNTARNESGFGSTGK